MIVDFLDADAPSDIDVDLCIVGAGAAGLFIAQCFVDTRLRVCVLESGGLSGELRTQELSGGSSAGDLELDPATARMRVFGGSCNLWGGGCIPLTPLDLQPRDWVPNSGWPLSYGDLEPYYSRARDFCGIGLHEFAEGSSRASPSIAPIQFDSRELANRLFAMSPVLFGSGYRHVFERAGNVTVLLHANLLELVPSSYGHSVDSARIASLDGRRGVVRARQYVLACGGIENARLLLLSNSLSTNGLGNDHDLVGRYFMDHPAGKLGDLWLTSPGRLTRPYQRIMGAGMAPAFPEICLTDEGQRRHRVLNSRVRPIPVEGPLPRGVRAIRDYRTAWASRSDENELVSQRICAALSLNAAKPTLPRVDAYRLSRLLLEVALGAGGVAQAAVRRLAGRPTVDYDHVELFGFFEQAPNPDSRILLGHEVDALGQRRVRVDWRLTELDHRTYRTAAHVFGDELAKQFGGVYRPERWVSSTQSADAADLRGTAHHMGTTRMSPDPQTGVVDVDCRVHGIDNLYIAGSSTFPTGGWAFPTLTIVALSLRIADRLRELLGAGPLYHSSALTAG